MLRTNSSRYSNATKERLENGRKKRLFRPPIEKWVSKPKKDQAKTTSSR